MLTSPPPTSNSSNKSSTSSSHMRFIKGDNQTFKNDLKIVKFAEKVDHIPASLLSPPSSNASVSKQSIITNDRFYGSPSKMQPPTPTPPPSTHLLASHSVAGLMSFNDRLKKNSISLSNNVNGNGNNASASITASKFDLESPSPCNNLFGGAETQSLVNYDSNSNSNNNAVNTNFRQEISILSNLIISTSFMLQFLIY